tara:strand:+ start:3485 stop:3952 length:468 start_codon:yes stop_codon:yes gene_type:complete
MLKIFKIRDVKTPERSGRNAGFDFYVPFDIAHDEILGGFYINPQTHISIPSGIKVRLPKNHCLVAFNKSGIAAKYLLTAGATLVDENYTGEISLSLINVGKEPVFIRPGMKIMQFVLLKQNYFNIQECKNEEDLYEKGFDHTERGSGGFGSTGIR